MITSFDLIWQDCSLHDLNDLSEEKTNVHRKRCTIMCAQYDGYSQVIRSGVAQIDKDTVERLFALLEQFITEVKVDREKFAQVVCDCSNWILRIRNSSCAVQKYEGIVFYPSSVKPITAIMQDALLAADVQPMLFGWHDHHEE